MRYEARLSNLEAKILPNSEPLSAIIQLKDGRLLHAGLNKIITDAELGNMMIKDKEAGTEALYIILPDNGREPYLPSE